jgi:hypothetical protein
MYSTTLGRFLQTDPIGYADGMNWYNYVGSDPVNANDPSGLQELDEITITAHWQNGPPLYSFGDLLRDEEIDRTIELNNYNREPTDQNTRATCKADGGAWDPSGNGGKGGCIAPIVVTGTRAAAQPTCPAYASCGGLTLARDTQPRQPGPNSPEVCEAARDLCDSNSATLYDRNPSAGKQNYFLCQVAYRDCANAMREYNKSPDTFGIIRFPRTGTVYFFPYIRPYFVSDW